MTETVTPLKKLTRAQLLEMLVEQKKAVSEVFEEKEQLEKLLQEKSEEVERLKTELANKDDEIKDTLLKLKKRLLKSNTRVKALKESLDAEQRIRMQSLLESKTISEASAYMNQLLEDTRKANILYQKLIMKLAEEARKHEQTGK